MRVSDGHRPEVVKCNTCKEVTDQTGSEVFRKIQLDLSEVGGHDRLDYGRDNIVHIVFTIPVNHKGFQRGKSMNELGRNIVEVKVGIRK